MDSLLLAVNEEQTVEEEVWEMALADKNKEALSAITQEVYGGMPQSEGGAVVAWFEG